MNNNSSTNNNNSTNTNNNINKDKDIRSSTGTEYKLSTNSNSGSRRSSLAGTGNDIYLNGGEANNNNHNTFSNGRLSVGGNDQDNNTFNTLYRYLGPQISDLHDSVITLESNMDRLNTIHNNLVDLNESFGSFLYGLICSSSCLQFPGLPNNIQEQMKVIERLNQLETEKKTLLRQIKETKSSMMKSSTLTSNNNNSSSNCNNSRLNQNFSKPLFTVNETKKMRTTMNKNVSNLSKNINRNSSNSASNDNGVYNERKEDGYDDGDDTSSEASFVLNPSNSQQEYVRNMNTDNMDRRYRRKSILNVIRNSAGFNNASESNMLLNGKTHINNEHGTNTISNRYSLGGRARRVTHGSTLISTSNPIANQQRSKTTVTNPLARRKTVTKRPKSISERPPFR